MVALLLSFLLSQDKAAEEALKKIEEKIAAADTIKADFRVEGVPFSKDAKDLASSSGTIEIKKGNKVRVLRTIEAQGQKMECELTSDGKAYFGRMGRFAAAAEETPKTLEANARAWFSTLPTLSLELLGTPERNKDAREFFKVTAVRSGLDESNLKTLLVTLKPSREEGPTPELKIWYDPKSCLISKRILTSTKGDTPITIVETFSNIILGAAIGDDVFEVPK